MKTVYYAYFDSRNFSFAAVDLTREKALQSLIAGLEKHTEIFDLETDWYSVEEDLHVIPMKIGVAYRDRSEIELNT
jgi:hypothetical protein